jgi:hypothetical protein
MVFSIVAPSGLRGLWFWQIWFCSMSESFSWILVFSSSLVLEKIYKWPYLIFAFCDYLPFEEDWFYVPLKNISLIWRPHHCRWRAAKFRPMLSMLGAQGLWAGRDLYRATLAVTRDLGFSGLILWTALFSRLLRYMRECGGSILTRIFKGFFEEDLARNWPV